MSLDVKHARRPIRDLVKALEFRASFGRPCYLKRNQQYAALIVPQYTDGPEGSYAYLRTLQRATVHEAEVLGFVVVGAELVDVPAFSIPRTHWAAEPAHQGRTIRLAGRAS